MTLDRKYLAALTGAMLMLLVVSATATATQRYAGRSADGPVKAKLGYLGSDCDTKKRPWKSSCKLEIIAKFRKVRWECSEADPFRARYEASALIRKRKGVFDGTLENLGIPTVRERFKGRFKRNHSIVTGRLKVVWEDTERGRCVLGPLRFKAERT